jgi:hypothetical protein
MKKAIGLFHFNVQYVAGDNSGYHRYCTQAIIPFLNITAENPDFRFTFEISGSGLEFLAAEYPDAISILRRLCESGQIELISSTYCPTLWPAFTELDLRKSIEINMSSLAKLELKSADIFFSQEAFFGTGLSSISDLFSSALCKDDYLAYQLLKSEIRPAYRLGELVILTGSNHLLREVARKLLLSDGKYRSSLPSSHEQRLRGSISNEQFEGLEDSRFIHNGIEWFWYHMGSGHHLLTPGVPTSPEDFFLDNSWVEMNIEYLYGLIGQGYNFGTLSELKNSISANELYDCPFLLEGSWNSAKSLGIQKWMGNNEFPWQNNSAVLSHAWRARSALRKAERLLPLLPDEDQAVYRGKFETAWKNQIVAESSDSFGWNPLPIEIEFGRKASDLAFRCSEKLRLDLAGRLSNHNKASSQPLLGVCNADKSIMQLPTIDDIIGGEGALSWSNYGPNIYMCDVEISPTSRRYGIRFKRLSDLVTYCPSCREWQSHSISVNQIKPEVIYLPLSNGLIGVSSKHYIIRANIFCLPPAVVMRASEFISFEVSAPLSNKRVHWRFYYVNDTIESALSFANQVNEI